MMIDPKPVDKTTRGKNRVFLAILLGVVALLFAITIIKIKGQG